MTKSNVITFLAGYFCIIFLLSLNSRYYGFEQGLYKEKFNSIVQDRDFNLINNIKGEFSKTLTPTDNVGDMHDIGAPIIWSFCVDIISIFIKDINSFYFSLTPTSSYSSSWTITIILYLFLIYFLRKWLVDSREKEKIFWTLIISLGIHDYCLDQVFNADILAMFLMTFIYLRYIKSDDSQNWLSHYELGLLMGILRFIKVTSFLYVPAIYLAKIFQYKTWKERGKFTIRFTLGYGLMFLTISVNNYINFGDWSFLQGYNYSYFWDGFLMFNGWKATYLYPRGLFTHSSILILFIFASFFNFHCWVKEKNHSREAIFFTFAALGIFLKLLLPFFCPADHFLALGARQFFIDLPIIFFFLCSFQKYYPKVTDMFLLLSISTAIYFNSEWNLLDKNPEVFSYSPLLPFKDNFSNILSFFPYLSERVIHTLKSIFLQTQVIPIYTFFIVFFSIIRKISHKEVGKSILILSFSFIFLFYSYLNLRFNHENTSAYLKKSGYQNKILGNGGWLYLYHEITSGMALGRYYEENYGNKSSQAKLKKVHDNFLVKLREDIIFIGKNAEENKLESGYLKKGTKFNIDLLNTSQSK